MRQKQYTRKSICKQSLSVFRYLLSITRFLSHVLKQSTAIRLIGANTLWTTRHETRVITNGFDENLDWKHYGNDDAKWKSKLAIFGFSYKLIFTNKGVLNVEICTLIQRYRVHMTLTAWHITYSVSNRIDNLSYLGATMIHCVI